MRRFRLPALLTVIVALFLSSSTVGVAIAATNAPTVKVTLASGRFYLLHYLPGDLTPKPLVVALHGYNGSATNVQGVTGLNPWSNARGNNVNIAYPQGVDAEWNAGSAYPDLGCCSGSQADDVSYLRDVVASISARTPTTAVYAWGFSNGGMMAVRAVCEAPDVFLAAATVEAGPAINCPLPVRVVAIHQTQDLTVLYNGGPVNFAGTIIGSTLPDQATSYPDGTNFQLNLCTLPRTTKPYHSWTSPCWPTLKQVDDLLWAELTSVSPPLTHPAGAQR